MNTLKHTYLAKGGKRKILAVLVMVFTCSNSQVSAVKAAELAPQIDRMVIAQTVTDLTPAPTAPETPAVQPTVQDVLLNVCASNGYGEECAKTLLGIMWNESSNRSTIIGDHGKARGYFQIHYKLHNISIECAEDLVCSANWTLNYLEAHSYPRYVSFAIQCHNSCNVNNGYAAKAIRNGQTFWDTPLEITQAKPIVLAMK